MSAAASACAVRRRPLAAGLALSCICACTGRAPTDLAAAGDVRAGASVDACEDVTGPYGEGPLWLQLQPGSSYCVEAAPYAPLEEELERKAVLSPAPADHFLPLEDGEHDVEVGACLASRGAAFSPALDEQGARTATWTVSRASVFGRTRVTGTLRVLLVDDASKDDPLVRTWEVVLEGFEDDVKRGVVLDGSPWPDAASTTLRQRLCQGPTCEEEEARAVAACPSTITATERHEVEFAGGRVEVRLAVSDTRVVVERISGVLDGEAFEVDGYFQSVGRISPDDYWSRDVLARFDAPVADGVCGLQVRRLQPYTGAMWSLDVLVRRCDGAQERREPLSHEYASLTQP